MYNVSEFLDEHPGGKNILLRWAGTIMIIYVYTK